MAYKAILFSLLTVPYHRPPLDTIQDIIESPMKVQSKGTILNWSEEPTNDPVIEQLNKKIIEFGGNLKDAMKNVSSGRIIMLENKEALQYQKLMHSKDKWEMFFKTINVINKYY